MGNWSINPNTLASIDDNGKATFQEHTQDTNYTITYNDGTSGNITKTFTVYACSQPPVDCRKYGFTANTLNEVPSVASSQQLAFSIYSEGELTATVVEGSDVVTGITAPTAGPNYQYIGWFAENQSTSPKHAKIRYTSSDGCEWEQTVTQKGAVDCDAYWANINFNKYEQNIPSGGGDWLIGTTTEDKEQLNYTYDEGGLIEDVYDLIDPSSHAHVYIGHYAANTSSSSKSASITFISQDGNCQSATTVTQAGAVDCTKYQFEDMSPTIDASGTGLNYPTVAKTSLGPNIGPLSYLTGSTWITYQGTREEHSPDKFLYKISCPQNDGSEKTGSITFTNNDGCTFTATVKQNGKNVTVSLRGITPIDGNLDLVGTDYSMHCTWNNGVKTVECSSTPNTADTAQNIFITAGGVSYRDGSIIKSATLVNNCPSQSSTYFRLVSAQWSVYSDRYELDMLFSPCGT